MKRLLTRCFYVVGSLILLSSCSDFNAVIKSDDYALKLERANEYYEEGIVPKIKKSGKKKYKDGALMRAVSLYEQVYQRMPRESEGELSYFRIGKAYYLSGDFYMGGYYLAMFPQRFPYSVKAEEALFLSAMCSVQNSPHYTLDQEETEIAINDLQMFVDKYPNSELIDSCNRIIDKLNFKIETKDYDAVVLYSNTERFGAAVTTAETFLSEYPNSIYSEEISYLLVKNSYLLAKNSVESKKMERIEDTFERYRTFVGTFPESTYVKALSDYYDELTGIYAELKPTGNK